MATIKDVAALAKVSVFTVSGVLNNSDKVRPETRERVLKAIEELQYVPNQTARALRTQRSMAIGVHFPLFASQTSGAFFTKVGEGVHKTAGQHGYHIVLSTSDASVEQEAAALADLVARNVDGLIIAPTYPSRVRLPAGSPPVVLVDRDAPQIDADRVFSENIESARESVNFLIEKGHTRIGYVGLTFGYSSHVERYEGYQAALQDHNITFDPVLVRGDILEHPTAEIYGYDACMRLCAAGATAIFCDDAYATLGAFRYLREHGLRVPDDMAILSYDDLEWCALVDPPLSTVRQALFEIGATSVRMLLGRLADPELAFRVERFPAELVHRGSV